MDQMADMGIKWVLIGHSERRGEFGLPTPKESNALLATKLAYILEKGLNCVFCIGEPLPIREKGVDAVLAECANQLEDIVPILKSLEDKSRVVIAYEPVWAIGTGVAATPEQAQETHKGIRDWIAKNVDQTTADEIRIQYGAVWKPTSVSGAPDNSSPSHFSEMTRPSWLDRAVRNRHRHTGTAARRTLRTPPSSPRSRTSTASWSAALRSSPRSPTSSPRSRPRSRPCSHAIYVSSSHVTQLAPVTRRPPAEELPAAGREAAAAPRRRRDPCVAPQEEALAAPLLARQRRPSTGSSPGRV